jgi:hypothetical protein
MHMVLRVGPRAIMRKRVKCQRIKYCTTLLDNYCIHRVLPLGILSSLASRFATSDLRRWLIELFPERMDKSPAIFYVNHTILPGSLSTGSLVS